MKKTLKTGLLIAAGVAAGAAVGCAITKIIKDGKFCLNEDYEFEDDAFEDDFCDCDLDCDNCTSELKNDCAEVDEAEPDKNVSMAETDDSFMGAEIHIDTEDTDTDNDEE